MCASLMIFRVQTFVDFSVWYRWSLPCWSTRQWRSLQWWRARTWTAVRWSRPSLFSPATTGRSKVGQGYRNKRNVKFGFWLMTVCMVSPGHYIHVYCSVFGLMCKFCIKFLVFWYPNRFIAFANFSQKCDGEILLAPFASCVSYPDPHWFLVGWIRIRSRSAKMTNKNRKKLRNFFAVFSFEARRLLL